jgi:hypothetical protein
MGWTQDELRGYLLFHDTAVTLLTKLQGHGFKWKKVEQFRFCPYPGTAYWRGIDEEKGYIEIHLGCEPGAVAHELGHGFHECLRRDRMLENSFGEDYAEAFRWFCEEIVGSTAWCQRFTKNKRNDAVLNACGYKWEAFVERLNQNLFYPS